MPFNGRQGIGRQSNNFCCNACRNLDFCPYLEMKSMASQIENTHSRAFEIIENLQSELRETKKTLQDVLDKTDEIKSCKICMENYNDGDKTAVKLQCPHIFCKNCVKQIQEQR